MLSAGRSGFAFAPATKGLMFVVGACSVAVPLLRLAPTLGLLAPRALVVGRLELWRLVTSQLFFSSGGEVLFGMMLLYFFRLLERQLGTAKFCSFVAATAALTAALTLAAAVILPQPAVVPLGSSGGGGRAAVAAAAAAAGAANRGGGGVFFRSLAALGVAFPADSPPATGPYGFIFACLVQFAADVPPAYRFRFLGVAATDKVFTFLLAFQLLFAGSPGASLPALIGVLAGIIYRADSLGLQSLSLPRALRDFGADVCMPLLGYPPQSRATLPPATAEELAAASQAARSAAAQAAATGRAAAAAAAADAPRPDPTGGGGDSGIAAAAAATDPRATAALAQFAQSVAANYAEHQQQQQQQRPAAAPTATSAAPVDPAALASLEAMGFPRARCEQVLRQTGGDVDSALAILLE